MLTRDMDTDSWKASQVVDEEDDNDGVVLRDGMIVLANFFIESRNAARRATVVRSIADCSHGSAGLLWRIIRSITSPVAVCALDVEEPAAEICGCACHPIAVRL